jgi:preprotein translocase subunit SecD
MLYNIFQYSLAVAALIFLGISFLVKPKRGVLIWAAASAAVAAISAHYHVFWALAVFTIMIPWALFCAGEWIDISWRLRAGFCVFLAFASALAIYPTYIDERYNAPDNHRGISDEEQAALDAKAKNGDLGFGRFIRSNIPFRLVRGLDLKGGLRLVYNVDVQEAIKSKRDRYFDEVRQELARSFDLAKEGETITREELEKLDSLVHVEKSRDDVGKIDVTFVNPADSAKINDKFLTRFVGEMNVIRAADKKSVSFRIKPEAEAEIRRSSVEQAKETVHRRVDGLGLKEAAVSTQGEENIVVEVPGSDERAFKEIKDIIAQTARLEFKMVDDDSDFFAKARGAKDLPPRIKFGSEDAPVGPGNSRPVWYAYVEKLPSESLSDALKVLQDWAGPVCNADESCRNMHQVAYEKLRRYDEDKDDYEEIGWRTYYVFAKADVTGDMISDARTQTDQGSGAVAKWSVGLEFTPVGAERFEDVTGKNIQRRFAIILDDKVESAPVIQSKIGGGSAQITMGSDSQAKQLDAANKLVLVLKAGALPAPIAMSNQQIIGPSLGSDAIFQGLKGAGAGGLLVLIMMVTIYARAGFIANIAVMFNLVLQVAILAMFGASMTLPGIAGLALTVGIAVDANVLINERIRDELRLGKSARSAVDVGYDRAFTAILDGHVTSLISGLILMQYGTGPIKGFAITLIVGVVVSLFTGVVCTRLMFDWAVRWRKIKKLSLG